jgi:hypothetical protein
MDVSVIVGVKNGAGSLQRYVDGIARQTSRAKAGWSIGCASGDHR